MFSVAGMSGVGDFGGDPGSGSSKLYLKRVGREVGEDAVKEEK